MNQWAQLWEDIQTKADARLFNNSKLTPHFLGAVVLDPQPKSGLIGVDTLHIIDGQQRLLTITILMAVLRDVSKEISEEFSDLFTSTSEQSDS